MKKRIFALCAALLVCGSICPSAYAEEDHTYTKQELIDRFWTQYWDNTLPGEQNPEGSLEYHILEDWLNEQYGHTESEDRDKYTVSDWTSDYSIRNAWRDYYQEYTNCWNMNHDEETGEFTIEEYDPETEKTGDLLYTFELKNGMWNMLDTEGNVVDTFEPHGGDGSYAALQEKEKGPIDWGEVLTSDETSDTDDNAESVGVVDTDDGEPAGGRVTGDVGERPSESRNDLPDRAAYESKASESVSSVDKDDEDGSSPLPYIAGGVGIAAAFAAAGFILSKRGKK